MLIYHLPLLRPASIIDRFSILHALLYIWLFPYPVPNSNLRWLQICDGQFKQTMDLSQGYVYLQQIVVAAICRIYITDGYLLIDGIKLCSYITAADNSYCFKNNNYRHFTAPIKYELFTMPQTFSLARLILFHVTNLIT